MRRIDVAVIGGGQSALAAGYYLRRSGLRFTLLDASPQPGGAWSHAWPSLTLFSPGRWSSLPGWMMPPTAGPYPTRDETIAYLRAYEARYDIPVERPVSVVSTRADGATLLLRLADTTSLQARAVISATGTWGAPVVPALDGQDVFHGRTLHSAQYTGPDPFADQRVLVVGAGNSGAQIYADLIDRCRVTWVTREAPVFLPDHVDGQYLFDQATLRYKAQQEGRPLPPPASLGDIVMVASVRALRERDLLRAAPMFSRFTAQGVQWPDGRQESVDAVIFATGFRPALGHLAPLVAPDERGRIGMAGLHAAAHERLYPLGYGDWTGFASATLVGVGRSARAVVADIERVL